MKKTVKIKDTNSNQLTSYTITSTTFGQLQKELSLDFSGKKVIVRETRHTLESANAKLPDGDFILFVMPQKTKAGVDFYDELDFQTLRSISKERGLPGGRLSADIMRKALRKQDENTPFVHTPKPIEDDVEDDIIVMLDATTTNAHSLCLQLELLKDKLISIKLGTKEPTIEYLDEIIEEFEMVRKELGL